MKYNPSWFTVKFLIYHAIIISAAGIAVVAKGSAKPIMKDGVEYLQAEKIITKLKIGNGQITIDDTERPVAGKQWLPSYFISYKTI